ncbi:hypothetical protein KIPB_005658, partial [Kipferlia bialata]
DHSVIVSDRLSSAVCVRRRACPLLDTHPEGMAVRGRPSLPLSAVLSCSDMASVPHTPHPLPSLDVPVKWIDGIVAQEEGEAEGEGDTEGEGVPAYLSALKTMYSAIKAHREGEEKGDGEVEEEEDSVISLPISASLPDAASLSLSLPDGECVYGTEGDRTVVRSGVWSATVHRNTGTAQVGYSLPGIALDGPSGHVVEGDPCPVLTQAALTALTAHNSGRVGSSFGSTSTTARLDVSFSVSHRVTSVSACLVTPDTPRPVPITIVSVDCYTAALTVEACAAPVLCPSLPGFSGGSVRVSRDGVITHLPGTQTAETETARERRPPPLSVTSTVRPVVGVVEVVRQDGFTAQAIYHGTQAEKTVRFQDTMGEAERERERERGGMVSWRYPGFLAWQLVKGEGEEGETVSLSLFGGVRVDFSHLSPTPYASPLPVCVSVHMPQGGPVVVSAPRVSVDTPTYSDAPPTLSHDIGPMVMGSLGHWACAVSVGQAEGGEALPSSTVLFAGPAEGVDSMDRAYVCVADHVLEMSRLHAAAQTLYTSMQGSDSDTEGDEEKEAEAEGDEGVEKSPPVFQFPPGMREDVCHSLASVSAVGASSLVNVYRAVLRTCEHGLLTPSILFRDTCGNSYVSALGVPTRPLSLTLTTVTHPTPSEAEGEEGTEAEGEREPVTSVEQYRQEERERVCDRAMFRGPVDTAPPMSARSLAVQHDVDAREKQAQADSEGRERQRLRGVKEAERAQRRAEAEAKGVEYEESEGEREEKARAEAEGEDGEGETGVNSGIDFKIMREMGDIIPGALSSSVLQLAPESVLRSGLPLPTLDPTFDKHMAHRYHSASELDSVGVYASRRVFVVPYASLLVDGQGGMGGVGQSPQASTPCEVIQSQSDLASTLQAIEGLGVKVSSTRSDAPDSVCTAYSISEGALVSSSMYKGCNPLRPNPMAYTAGTVLTDMGGERDTPSVGGQYMVAEVHRPVSQASLSRIRSGKARLARFRRNRLELFTSKVKQARCIDTSGTTLAIIYVLCTRIES